MGKPPRERVRMAEVSSIAHGTDGQASGFDQHRKAQFACSSGGAGAIGDGLAMDPEPQAGFNSIPLSWGAFDGCPANLMPGGDAADPSSTGLLGLPLPDAMSVDFNHDLSRPYNLPDIEGHSISSRQAKSSPAQMNNNRASDDALMTPFTDSDHDCGPEAYDILISLSSPRSDPAPLMSVPGCAQPALRTGNNYQVPVDQILRLNREASERLGLLLTCSCSRRPHLALLYASIISLILTLYQQAAGCSQVDSAIDTASCPVSSPGSLSESPSPWSSTMASTVDGRTFGNPAANGAMQLALEPAQMTMGSFRVDDQEVRAALTIQLVLGEIKRAGHLIDLLTSRSSSGTDEPPIDGVDSLYKTLASWFRWEHSRVVENLKSRLEEISP